MVFARRRLAAVAIPAQVRHDQRVVLGKFRRDLTPENVSLRKSVQKKERWPFATRYEIYGRFGRINRPSKKSRREFHFAPRGGRASPRLREDISSKQRLCSAGT